MKSRHLDKYMSEAVSGVQAAVSSHTATAYLDRRDAERVPLHIRASYASDDSRSIARKGHILDLSRQGQLLDLSKTGCKIVGEAPVLGTTLALVLDFDDDKDPLCISGAEVTWRDHSSFGVRFTMLGSAERHRLQEVVLKYATFRGRSQEYIAFRVA